ncbi:MAG: hypothetical protein U0Q07_04450 [Acidimicrobiales bacterium]
MATQRSSWEKRERDKAKRARADAKRARRQDRKTGEDDEASEETPTAEVDQEAVIAELAALHAAFADDQIDFDEFEERKAELTARLAVD